MADHESTPRPGTTIRRRLGTLQLATACGLVLFWIYFFAVENRNADADPIYLAFERSFPVPDLLWLTPLLIVGGWSMQRGGSLAVPCSMAAGGAMVFLGLLDVSFNIRQARYTISLADGLMNGLINSYCILGGLALILLTWRSRSDRPPATSAAVRSQDAQHDQRVVEANDQRVTEPTSAGSNHSRQPSAVPRGTDGLAGRHVIVTGGSSGIGLAVAMKLAGRGAHVTILARNRERLDAAADRIDRARRAGALPCLAPACDVADPEQVDEAFEAIARADRRPDILINSAGIAEPGYFDRQPLDVFERQMRINYFGTLYTTRRALPAMIESGRGHIVNVSSVAGFLGVFGYAGYAASKFAVWGFSEAIRAELRPHGIGVSVVCPPDTDTPQLRKESRIKPRETKAIGESVKVMSADQVADAVIRGIERRQFIVVPGFESKLVRAVLGLSRSIIYRILDRKVDKLPRAEPNHE